ncbi:MAG TPA: hemerythrin domain-containing protein [Polyangiales bacterium]|nr:hemerythrin domain-containing protein [Polyangiales bacterium]
MNPSHIRSRILQEHDALRHHLGTLAEAVDRMLVEHAHLGIVRQLARKLLGALASHTELEDALLGPALLELDAWGPVRVELMLTHHEQQRTQARGLLELFEHTDNPLRIAHLADELVKDLRSDMEHEERDILREDLLRDDPVAISAECS